VCYTPQGYTKPVTFAQLFELLTPDKELILHHDKWFRSLTKSNITIKDTVYSISVLENKREWIIEDGNYHHSLPYTLPLSIDIQSSPAIESPGDD
jgi:hypothetical protein